MLSAGLGLARGARGGAPEVRFVVEGSAAAAAGIQAGDEIVAINGAPVARGSDPR